MNCKERLKDYLKGYSSQYDFKDKNNIEHNLNDDIEEMLKEINKITDLEQKCKKQKEVIDKAIEFIKSSQCKYDGWEIENQLYENEINQLLDILNEVQDE